MIKKLGLLAAAGFLAIAATATASAPASAEVTIIKRGGGYHHHEGWRRPHAYMRHDRGWHRGGRSKTVIIRH